MKIMQFMRGFLQSLIYALIIFMQDELRAFFNTAAHLYDVVRRCVDAVVEVGAFEDDTCEVEVMY